MKSDPSLPPNAAAEVAINRAQLLVGCYRREDFADVDIASRSFVSALARYPESVVIAVTDPATGIPSKLKWPPAISELVEACEALAIRGALVAKSDAVQQQTIALRAEDKPRAERPTLSELREKYGPNWGLTKADVDRADRHIQRLAREESSLHAKILAEYSRLGRDPVYAGEILLSPSLVEKLNPPWRVTND